MEIITEDYCSFELSKLLKEKGFSNGTIGCFSKYLKTNKSDNPAFTYTKGEVEFGKDYIVNNSYSDMSNKTFFQCERPTYALVIKWLRIKHNIFITIDCKNSKRPDDNWEFEAHKNNGKVYSHFGYNSSEEAAEKGITEVLNLL